MAIFQTRRYSCYGDLTISEQPCIVPNINPQVKIFVNRPICQPDTSFFEKSYWCHYLVHGFSNCSLDATSSSIDEST